MFDIQRFADGGEGSGEGQQQQQQTTPQSETKDTSEGADKQTDNKPEVDIDAKINEAISKAQKAWEADLKKREAAHQKELERQKKEAERLSKLSDEERQKAEIENGRKELEIKEKELQRKELMLEMTKVLAERKIPVQFMEYLIADDNESTLERIKTFEKEYKSAIEAAVNEKLKGKAPQAAGGKGTQITGNERVKGSFMKAILDNQVKRG